jgi:membrane associated rhomboid family serine protease
LIPLRDSTRSQTFPLVVVALIAANVVVFVYELLLGKHLAGFLDTHGFVPFRFWHAESFRTDVAIPALASMFLHAGWLHLIGNMWFLWIFGDNVEDRLGHPAFLLFYLIAGLVAMLTHAAFSAAVHIPSIGASGAIAGVLGAYIVLYPRGRVLTLLFLFFFIQLVELPAFLFLGLWFGAQVFSGVASLPFAGEAAGGVAWWAHIGGFAFGALCGLVLRKVPPRKRRRPRRRPIVVELD